MAERQENLTNRSLGKRPGYKPIKGPRTTPAGLVQTEPMKGWGRGDVTLDGARLGPGLTTRRVF